MITTWLGSHRRIAMGLDTYAVYGKGHPKYNPEPDALNSIPDELFPSNRLSGGLFSGGGSSFRGKIYNDWVEYITNVSLYEDQIDPEVVGEMTDLLLAADEKKFKWFDENRNDYNISWEETQDLAEWFRVVSNENGTIISWY